MRCGYWESTSFCKTGKRVPLSSARAITEACPARNEKPLTFNPKVAAGHGCAISRTTRRRQNRNKSPRDTGGIGGVVGRSKFVEINPENEKVFTSRESYFRFWRAYHRLTRPVVSHTERRIKTGHKFAQRIFGGRSLGWSSTRGIYGTSVWYSKPEIVCRIMEWAEGLTGGG